MNCEIVRHSYHSVKIWYHCKPLPVLCPAFASAALHKALSIQDLSQIERPWENVTLNRCLFVAITILVLTSGFQRLHGK